MLKIKIHEKWALRDDNLELKGARSGSRFSPFIEMYEEFI